MRVLIYGGRDFARKDNTWDREVFDDAWAFLNHLALTVFPRTEEDEYGNYLPAITVISGGGQGADQIGEDFGVVNWTGLEIYKPDWDKYGKGAGPIRNQQMLDSGVDLAIQFPGGKGTADMRSRLDKAGVRVIEYKE